MKPSLPRIAAICSEFHVASHSDVIVSRWLEPFPTDHLYGWGPLKTQIASAYAEQRKMTSDLLPAHSLRYGFPVFDSIEGALTLGSNDLAVDGILLIAEHGTYPTNDYRQKLYPRKEYLDEILRVFERSGRVVPVFLDKHLSWNTEWIAEMYHAIRDRGIPFMAGSSIPFSNPPELTNFPPGQQIQEVVCSYYGDFEGYFFHSREFAETFIEKRDGATRDIESLVVWENATMWDAVDRGEFSWELAEAACESHTVEARDAIRARRRDREEPSAAFQFRYADGLRVTHVWVNQTVKKQCLAARMRDGSVIAGTSLSAGGDHYYPHFARFCRQIEDFMLSGKSPVPLERSYVTSMTTALAMHATAKPGEVLSPPELKLP